MESLNARYRSAVNERGHFPTEQAAVKCHYLVTRSLNPEGTCQTRWTMRWKPSSPHTRVQFCLWQAERTHIETREEGPWMLNQFV